jgi:hypothetical protein
MNYLNLANKIKLIYFFLNYFINILKYIYPKSNYNSLICE